MRKTHGLKVRRYAYRLIDLNYHLAVFPGAKISDTICTMNLNEFLLNSMPKRCSKQAFVQGFDYEYIT